MILPGAHTQLFIVRIGTKNGCFAKGVRIQETLVVVAYTGWGAERGSSEGEVFGGIIDQSCATMFYVRQDALYAWLNTLHANQGLDNDRPGIMLNYTGTALVCFTSRSGKQSQLDLHPATVLVLCI